MKLGALAQSLPEARLEGDPEVEILGISHDSRDVQPGWLYVALPGRRVDGSAFIPQAKLAGAVAFALPEGQAYPGAPTLWLPQPRVALPKLAAALHGHPARRLRPVGVTGTNGKTTTTTLLSEIAQRAGRPSGLFGTVEVRIGDRARPARFTTPESPELQATLLEMVEAGVDVVPMEVSSIGLEEHRVDELDFAAVAFLNLSVDHLDYHGDMATYGQAKRRLMGLRRPGAVAIINVEDEFGATLANEAEAPVWRLALDGRPAEVTVHHLHQDDKGFSGLLVTPCGQVALRCPLIGRFNVMNAATAGALALSLGLPEAAIAQGLAAASVPGRLQRVPTGAGVTVVVDYAHTPDALERVITALRPLAQGHLWCIFGCGGDRDKSKRAPMGQAAALADAVVVTSDNPRTEEPSTIARAAAEGATSAGRPLATQPAIGATCLVLDRREAIQAVLSAAKPGDMVLIAGKGHERYQEVMGVRHPFDDVEVAQAWSEGAP